MWIVGTDQEALFFVVHEVPDGREVGRDYGDAPGEVVEQLGGRGEVPVVEGIPQRNDTYSDAVEQALQFGVWEPSGQGHAVGQAQRLDPLPHTSHRAVGPSTDGQEVYGWISEFSQGI